MRRPRGVGAETPEDAPTTRAGDGEPARELPSAPSLLRLVFVVVLVSTLYTTLVVLRDGGGGTSPTALRAEGWPEGSSGGGSKLRSTFRQLHMMGFEEGSEQGGEWRTCKAYAESELPPHKKVRCTQAQINYLFLHSWVEFVRDRVMSSRTRCWWQWLVCRSTAGSAVLDLLEG